MKRSARLRTGFAAEETDEIKHIELEQLYK